MSKKVRKLIKFSQQQMLGVEISPKLVVVSLLVPNFKTKNKKLNFTNSLKRGKSLELGKTHQFLSNSAMGEVDADFIQPLEHQPKPSILEAEGIPLIDLFPLNSQESDEDSLHRLVAEVGEACEKWGFFQVINHGVPSQVRERIESASKEFFALPKEEKRKSSRDETNLFGYSDHEITKSVRDWKEIFDCTIENPTVIYASDDPNDRELKELTSQWPHYPPYLRQDSFNSLYNLYLIKKLHSHSFFLQRNM